MAKNHEAKLFVTHTTYIHAASRLHVHRTRKAARAFKVKQQAKKTVVHCEIRPATWGPDA